MVKHNNNLQRKTIAVFMFMITAFVFLSFNVFADTPVQPLQVITYSDTSTNVRISGTAERLHYNIDSFQVVFMNPPNNYGTSCTPVLVSFRFYNASDFPAYIGQPEFELTATTGTGAVNTIIYGYDQISTDLFVAESSYSTAEVGRIGIGASNDFAYYTGFVIPPRTSLYFSCIVYVNASAYGQNNTGAAEDVNQVTLSSLNLYTNQISFSADYPYHNQPIDFSTIIDAIGDLSSTVSTSSEMQSLINSLIYTGTRFNYTPRASSSTSITVTDPDYSYNKVTIYRRINSSYLIDTQLNYDSASDIYYVTGTERIPVYFYITNEQSNTEYKAISTSYETMIHGCFMSSTYKFSLQSVSSNLFENVFIEGQNIRLRYKIQHESDNKRGIIPYGVYTTVIFGYIDLPYGTSYTFPSLDGSDYFRWGPTSQVVNGYYPRDEYYILRDLYSAYSQVNGLNDSSDLSNDVADVSDNNHIIEESYYSANASAIEAAGLSNYRFSNEQNNGIGKVADDFMLLWNALGSWNGVYVFSLTMALATFIMRHRGMLPSRSKDNKGGDE